MTTFILILLCVFAVALFIQFGALIEMYEQLKQVRKYLDMVDEPEILDLGLARGLAASAVGLPAELDGVDRAMVLFLSTKCETCRQLAANLHGGSLPPGLWVVVVPVIGDGSDFVAAHELVGEHILVDVDEQITSRIGLDLSPVAVHVEGGKLAKAHTVPTVRQLYAAIPLIKHKRKFSQVGASDPAASAEG